MHKAEFLSIGVDFIVMLFVGGMWRHFVQLLAKHSEVLHRLDTIEGIVKNVTEVKFRDKED